MKLVRLFLLILGMLFTSPGFAMPLHDSGLSNQDEEFDQFQRSELETEFKAVSEELFESNLVYSLTFQKDGVSKNDSSSETHKYSGLYSYRAASIYLKTSRFIDPGLDQSGIIFPFHDFI